MGPLRRLVAVATLLAAVAGAVVPGASVPFGSGGVVTAAGSTTVYRPVGPVRLADTRADVGFTRISPDTIRIRVAGSAGVPSGAVAAVLTVAVDAPGQPGYVSVWPSGLARPTAANLTFAPGEIRANTTIVQLGSGGSVDVVTSVPADVVIDVSGAFVPASSATAGRYVPITSRRALDTRPGLVAAGDSVLLTPEQLGVPDDASAVALNVTTASAPAPGYFTAYPALAPRPEASILNVDAAGQTRGAFTIVPMSPGAGVRISTYGGGSMIVDVAGYVTGPGAPASTDGLFVPAAPQRIFDSRPWHLRAGMSSRVTGVPAGVAAIAANWTSVDPLSPTFLTAFPANGDRPPVATVNNAGRGSAVGNLGIVRVGGGGILAYSYAGEQLVVDLAGWFTGPEAPPTSNGRELPTSTTPRDVTTELAGLINGYRASLGLPAMQVCPRLAAGASQHALDNAARRTMSHRLADGSTSQDVMRSLGYSAASTVVDNIAYSSAPMTAVQVFEMWKRSAAHDRWLRDPGRVAMGAADALNPDGSNYWALYMSGDVGNC